MLLVELTGFDNCPLADFVNDRKSSYQRSGFSQGNRIELIGFAREVDKIKEECYAALNAITERDRLIESHAYNGDSWDYWL